MDRTSPCCRRYETRFPRSVSYSPWLARASAASPGVAVRDFVRDIERALDAGAPPAVAAAVSRALTRRITAGRLELAQSAWRYPAGRHARRLLHRDPGGRFCIVAMTWGPGQQTALHDHDGSWCVEAVFAGATRSQAFRLEAERDGRCWLTPGSRTVSRAGESGVLLPPFDHHVYGNASDLEVALTLHVYGPELLRSHTYEPQADGSWIRREMSLGYDPW